MTGKNIPTHDLQVGQWVYLECAGIVRITDITHFADSVEIEWNVVGSDVLRRCDQPMLGVWSGLYSDYPFITTYPAPED